MTEVEGLREGVRDPLKLPLSVLDLEVVTLPVRHTVALGEREPEPDAVLQTVGLKETDGVKESEVDGHWEMLMDMVILRVFEGTVEAVVDWEGVCV